MYFTCEYCNTKFIRESNYSKHFCESKKKAILLKNKLGRNAFQCYREWNKLRGYKATDDKTFLNSRYFKSFINFVEFSNNKMIPDRQGFMKLMVEREVWPSHWSDDAYYDFYMEQFDTIYSPIKQVELSLDFLTKLADGLNCPLDKVIYKLEPIELMRFISSRKLSPWLLLFTKSFQDYIRYHLKGEAKLLMETVINATHWKEKIKQNDESVRKIKDLMANLNL